MCHLVLGFIVEVVLSLNLLLDLRVGVVVYSRRVVMVAVGNGMEEDRERGVLFFKKTF